jgi:hypothetical protein
MLEVQKKKKVGKKPPKPTKTREDRLKEVTEMKEKIEGLGLSVSYPAIKEFYDVIDLFVEDGFPVSGKIRLKEHKRDICYILTNRLGRESSLALLYNENY